MPTGELSRISGAPNPQYEWNRIQSRLALIGQRWREEVLDEAVRQIAAENGLPPTALTIRSIRERFHLLDDRRSQMAQAWD